MIYKTYTTSLGQEYVKIEHGDGSVTCIPNDPTNTDYQAYLKYIEQGGLVLPADAGADTDEVSQ